MTAAALKAYVASDDEREAAVLVFGRRNDWNLRRKAAGKLGGEPYGLSITRLPAMDKFAGQRVTVQDYIENGWHYECHGCSRRVEADEMYDYDLDDEENEALELRPTYHPLWPRDVWCCASCRDDDIREHQETRAREADEFVRARDAALARWPGITIRHCGRQHYDKPETLRAEFTFPGQTTGGWADWTLASDALMVPRGDVNAWHQFARWAGKPSDTDPGDEAR